MNYLKIGVISILCLVSWNAGATERWFNQAVVDYGAGLFAQNCAVCHGANAEGTSDWKKTDANGNYPPPPLDGSAHAWHHSIPQLVRSIKEGGIKLVASCRHSRISYRIRTCSRSLPIFSPGGRTKPIPAGTSDTCSNFQLCYDAVFAGITEQIDVTRQFFQVTSGRFIRYRAG